MIGLRSYELQQQVSGGDLAAGFDEDVGDFAVPFGVDRRFHFHGFEGQKFLAFLDRVARLNGDGDDHAGHGGSDLVGVGGVRFDGELLGRLQRAIDDSHVARLAVEFKEDRA